MANYERGSNDPDDVRVFDGGEDDDDAEGSHLPMVIVISLLVLAAFGGVVWLAYNQGVARGRTDVPVHAVADNSANEPAATAPGGGEDTAPVKQIKVYQQPASADEDADQPVATAPPAALNKPPAALGLRAQPAETKPAVAKPAAVPVAKAVVPPPAPVARTSLPDVKTPPKPAPVKAVMAPAATGGAFVLQIGAYKSQDDAAAAWKAYQAKHAALLSGFSSDIQKADLGDKGVWYRLRTGSFADKDTAGALCDRLKADGGTCFPAK